MFRKLFSWLMPSPLLSRKESLAKLQENIQAMQTAAKGLPASPQKDAILNQIERQQAAVLRFRAATAG